MTHSQPSPDFDLTTYLDRLTMVICSVPNQRLSDLTGISRNTLTKYERQESTPDVRRLLSIADPYRLFRTLDFIWGRLVGDT
ncbi:helix-turn-helix domain-containing protein [Vibrio maritimus]|uniref:helix-turn-helix domain-containing protein n=1 Tax=Vibrio maritimus TaxID=990268 RepID=UPI00406919EE